jgi:hypothetical protein
MMFQSVAWGLLNQWDGLHCNSTSCGTVSQACGRGRELYREPAPLQIREYNLPENDSSRLWRQVEYLEAAVKRRNCQEMHNDGYSKS